MENISCIVVSFKQTEEEPEYIYFVSERPIKTGDYYLDATKSPFMRVAYMYTQKLHDRCRRLEATNNPKYLLQTLNITMIPEVFVKSYFGGGKQIKHAPLRVKE